MQASNRLRSIFQVKGLRKAELQFILVTIIPAVIFYAVLKYYPLATSFYMSLHDWQLMREDQFFTGFKNYFTILSDRTFLRAIQNTVVFAFTTSIITTVLGLLVAITMNPIRRGGSVIRLIYFLPNITAGIGIFVVWRWLYHPQIGFFNQILRLVGEQRINFLGSPQWALKSIIIMAIWGAVGYYAIILVAALRNIPAMYYEAAIVDGGNGFQIARYITIPLISPVLTFVFITSLIGSFNVFMPVYILTRGGPLDSTQVIAYQIYVYAFQRLWMGMASAMAFVLFVLVMTLTVVQLRLRKSDEESLA